MTAALPWLMARLALPIRVYTLACSALGMHPGQLCTGAVVPTSGPSTDCNMSSMGLLESRYTARELTHSYRKTEE